MHASDAFVVGLTQHAQMLPPGVQAALSRELSLSGSAQGLQGPRMLEEHRNRDPEQRGNAAENTHRGQIVVFPGCHCSPAL